MNKFVGVISRVPLLSLMLSLGLAACGTLNVDLAVLDKSAIKVDSVGRNVSGNDPIDKVVKLVPGREYQLLAEARGPELFNDLTITIPPERIASGTGRTSHTPPKSTLLFAQAKLKQIPKGEHFPVTAVVRDVKNNIARTHNLVLVSGEVTPEITELIATPTRVELGKPVTLNWQVLGANEQLLTVTDIRGNVKLKGTAQTTSFKPVKIGINTATIKATSITGKSISRSVNVEVIPPIRCELKRPKDQVIEIKGVNGNSHHNGARLVGQLAGNTRIMYGQSLISSDKAQVVVHQIQSTISPHKRTITNEFHSLVIFDMRTCLGFQRVPVGSGLTMGKMQLLSKGGKNWVAFTTIGWSGSSASDFNQTTTAIFQELSSKQAIQRQRRIQLSGIPYNDKKTSIFTNGAKDRAVILAMGVNQRNEFVRPYFVYSIDFTKIGGFPQIGELNRECAIISQSLACIKLDPPSAIFKKNVNYPNETGPPTLFEYLTTIPRYQYNFSGVVTNFKIAGDILSLEGTGEWLNGTKKHKGSVKLK